MTKSSSRKKNENNTHSKPMPLCEPQTVSLEANPKEQQSKNPQSPVPLSQGRKGIVQKNTASKRQT
jgi:hypothetical protein